MVWPASATGPLHGWGQGRSGVRALGRPASSGDEAVSMLRSEYQPVKNNLPPCFPTHIHGKRQTSQIIAVSRYFGNTPIRNNQHRELFVTPATAVDAAKKGEPLPNGTVITIVQYKAQVDAQGNPV